MPQYSSDGLRQFYFGIRKLSLGEVAPVEPSKQYQVCDLHNKVAAPKEAVPCPASRPKPLGICYATLSVDGRTGLRCFLHGHAPLASLSILELEARFAVTGIRCYTASSSL